MSRLGKKCFIAATSLHALLIAVILLAGLAFRPPEIPAAKHEPVFNVVKISDLPTMVRGGATEAHPTEIPKITPPPVAPPQIETPQTKPVEPPKADPPKPEAQTKPPEIKPEVKPIVDKPKPIRTHPVRTPDHVIKPRDPARDEPVKPVKTVKNIHKDTPQKDTKKDAPDNAELIPVRRASNTKPQTSKPRPQPTEIASVPDTRAIEAQRTAQILRQMSQSIGHTTAVSPPIVSVDPHPGTAGEDAQAQANYSDLVYAKYNAAWEPSAALDDDKAWVIARIRIQADGRVIEHEVERSSGNALMVRSIQAVLDRVTFIEPFPAGADKQPRTFLLKFNLQTKRAIG